MATVNSQQSGNWTDGSTWDSGAKPADGDTVVIKAEHTVTFDEDMSSWSSGVDLTVDGILQASTAEGDYYLLLSQNMDGSGTLQAGSESSEYPENCTFTIDAPKEITSVKVLLYAHKPTYRWIRASDDYSGTNIPVDTDVSSDWHTGGRAYFLGHGVTSSREITAMDSTSITVDSSISGKKNDVIVLMWRNIYIHAHYYMYLFSSIQSGSYVRAKIGGTGSYPSAVINGNMTITLDGVVYYVGNVADSTSTEGQLSRVIGAAVLASHDPVQGCYLTSESLSGSPIGAARFEGLRVGCPSSCSSGLEDGAYCNGCTIERVCEALDGYNIIVENVTIGDSVNYFAHFAWGAEVYHSNLGPNGFYQGSARMQDVTIGSNNTSFFDLRGQSQKVAIRCLHTPDGDGTISMTDYNLYCGMAEGPWLHVIGVDGDPAKRLFASPAGILEVVKGSASPLRTDWCLRLKSDSLYHTCTGRNEYMWYRVPIAVESQVTVYTKSDDAGSDRDLIVSLRDPADNTIHQTTITVAAGADWLATKLPWTVPAGGVYYLYFQVKGSVLLDWEIVAVTDYYYSMPFRTTVGQDQMRQIVECV